MFVPRHETVSEAQAAGSYPNKGIGYRVYTLDSNSAIAASSPATRQVSFDTAVELVAIGSAARSTGGTAVVGRRDTYSLILNRQTQDKLLTDQIIGTAYFGVYEQAHKMLTPWYFSAGEILQVGLLNLDPVNATQPDFTFHCKEIRRPGDKSQGLKPYRSYAKSTGPIGALGSVTVFLTFSKTVEIHGIGAAANAGGTAAIAYRDAFTIALSRQTGDKLIQQPVIGTSYFGVIESFRKLDRPWIFYRGESIQIDIANLTGSTITTDLAFHCLERD